MTTLSVKVVRVPGRTVEVELPCGATVQDALDTAQVQLCKGEACKLNAQPAEVSATLTDGDKIIIAKGAKGNS